MFEIHIKKIVETLDTLTDGYSKYLNINTHEIVEVSDEDLKLAESDYNLSDYPKWHQDSILLADELAFNDESFINFKTKDLI